MTTETESQPMQGWGNSPFCVSCTVSIFANAEDSALYPRAEQAMWRAVILQAMVDAVSKSSKPETVRARKAALTWLAGDSDDFVQVCEQAGWHADYVRKRVYEALSRHEEVAPYQTPATARNTKRLLNIARPPHLAYSSFTWSYPWRQDMPSSDFITPNAPPPPFPSTSPPPQ